MYSRYLTPLFILVALSCNAQVTPFTEGAGWSDHGPLSFSGFGWGMSTAGDVNGDGYEDMIVSAIDYSNPDEIEEEEGRIFLYYGGPDGLSETADWTYESNAAVTVLGFSVSGGDVNGDGYSDIVAGGLQWTGVADDEGRVFLWYGSPTGPNVGEPDWTLSMGQEGALFGSGVAMNGDLNGDGFDDLFMSAKQWSGPEPDEGKVWLYWGSPDGPVESGWTYEPNQAQAICGFPVNYAGDVNGDNYDDVVIGINAYDSLEENDGLVVLYYGGPGMPNTAPDWTASSGQKKSSFGHWTDGAGDVNGDGYDDVFCTAILYEDILAEGSEGRVFIYYGGPDGPSITPDWYGELNQYQAQLGYSCASAGDINNDGYDDLIAGAKYYDAGFEDEGGAFVWFGGPDGVEADYCWEGTGGQDIAYYGRMVGGASDFNNDGYEDFYVGAYRYSAENEQDGEAYVYYGGPRQSDFHYATDHFCIGTDNPTPIIDGIAGGTFYSPTAVINTTTGEVDLDATGVGVFEITYTAPESCPRTMTFEIEDPSVIDYFDYPSDTYCMDYVSIIPTIAAGASGHFYADDITVDPITGLITADALMTGTHTIYFEVTTEGGCVYIESEDITILPATEIMFSDDVFCRDAAFTTPVVTNEGGVFSSDDLVIDAASGTVNLLASPSGGPFAVYYTAMAYCPQAITYISIDSADHALAAFDYAVDTVCNTEAEFSPSVTPLIAGGTYSSDGASVDPETGMINPGLTAPGTYAIFYDAMDGSCAINGVTYITVIEGVDAAFGYGADEYLLGTPNPTPTAVMTGGTYTADPATLVLNASTGEIDLTLSESGTYYVTYTVANDFCSSAFVDTIIIYPACTEPDSLEIISVTTTSVWVGWGTVPGYDTYTVQLIQPDGSTVDFTCACTNHLFEGLIPDTTYSFRVMVDCAGLDVAWSEETSFRTEKELDIASLQPQLFSIYPNPTSGEFQLLFQEPTVGNAIIFDASGKQVYNLSLNGQTHYPVDMRDQPQGMFLLRVVTENAEASTLIVKQ